MDPSISNPKSSQKLGTRIWRGVTLQLFLVAVLPLTLLVLVVTFGSLQLHHDAMRSLVADRNLRAVQTASESLSREIYHRGQLLELLADELESGFAVEEAFEGANGARSAFEGGLAVVNGDAIPIFSESNSAVQELIASPELEQIRRTASEASPGKAVFLAVREVGSSHYVPVMVSLFDGAFLLGMFSPEVVLSEGLAIVSQAESVTAVVITQQFDLLYRHGTLNIGEDLSTHPGISTALSGQSGIDFLPTSEGEHVITTSAIQPVGWALMIEESWEDIASPLLRATQSAPLIIVPILGLMLVALWFGLRQIVQPMQNLERKAEDLARGNFESIRQPVGGVPEIRHLQDALAVMADQLREAQNSLHSYIGAITDSVEAERRNLAREIHDETLQSLIALGQHTQYAMHWNKDAKVENTLNQIMDLADQGTTNLRQLVKGLRPIYIEDLGLATALSMLSASADHLEEVQIHFLQKGEERRLKPEVELGLYRMAQEALTNVRRHSGAKDAWINLFFREDSIVLEILDDGSGFRVPPDPFRSAREGHYGLLSLYERAELLGAKLTIQSNVGEGTLVRIRLDDQDQRIDPKPSADLRA